MLSEKKKKVYDVNEPGNVPLVNRVLGEIYLPASDLEM